MLITLASGANFSTAKELKAIADEQLYFLQFKENILSKLPYMEGLSSIMYDLQDLVKSDTKDWSLIVDDPEILLNLYEENSPHDHIILFSELLKKKFFSNILLQKKPIDKNMNNKLNRLANILTGNI